MDIEERVCGELCRYQSDVWYFAMLLSDGTVLGFSSMEPSGDSSEFYGIHLLSAFDHKNQHAFGKKIEGASCSRSFCKVRKEHVVAILEIADT